MAFIVLLSGGKGLLQYFVFESVSAVAILQVKVHCNQAQVASTQCIQSIGKQS